MKWSTMFPRGGRRLPVLLYERVSQFDVCLLAVPRSLKMTWQPAWSMTAQPSAEAGTSHIRNSRLESLEFVSHLISHLRPPAWILGAVCHKTPLTVAVDVTVAYV